MPFKPARERADSFTSSILAVKNGTSGASDTAVFPFLCASIFLIYLDSTIVNVALPGIQLSISASLSDLQWLVNCYTLGLAALLLSAGAISDNVGRKKVLVCGLVGFGVASTACAVADSLTVLLSARCLQGASAALIVPPCISALLRCFPDPKRRSMAIGRMATVASLGTAAGPVIGGWLVQRVGWQSIFWVNVPVVSVTLVGVLLTMRQGESPEHRRLDLVGQVLMIGGLGLLTYALIERTSTRWNSPATIGTLGTAALLGLAFWHWERRVAAPLWPRGMASNPSVIVACASNFLGLMTFFVTQFVLVFWFQRVRGQSPLDVGTHLLWMTIAMMVASPLAGRWLARSGPRAPMLAGAAACGVGAVDLAFLPAGLGDPLTDVGLALMGCGIAAISASGTAAILSGVAPASVGVVSGAASTLRQLGAVFGVTVAGVMLSTSPTGESSARYGAGLATALGFAAVSSFVLLALASRYFGRRSPESESP